MNATDSRSADMSPDGRRIAFARDGEIYVMNADGSGQRNLTRNAAADSAPAWSSNGRKIAFGRKDEIYVMNADGRKLRRLTRNPASDSSPVFSPDGRKIVSRPTATATSRSTS